MEWNVGRVDENSLPVENARTRCFAVLDIALHLVDRTAVLAKLEELWQQVLEVKVHLVKHPG